MSNDDDDDSLSTNTDGSMANAKMVNSTRDSSEGGRHLSKADGQGDN